MGINPLAHFLDLLFVGWNTEGEVGTGALKGLVELEFIIRIDLYLSGTKILVEEGTEVELVDGGVVDKIVESGEVLLECCLHSLCEGEGCDTCPDGSCVASDRTFLLHEPVEESDACGLDVGTDDGVAESEILGVVDFAHRLGAVVEGGSIGEGVFEVRTIVAGKDAIGGHVDDTCMGVLGALHKVVWEVAIEEDCHSLVVLSKLIEETNTVNDSIEVAFVQSAFDEWHVGSISDYSAVEKCGC